MVHWEMSSSTHPSQYISGKSMQNLQWQRTVGTFSHWLATDEWGCRPEH